MQKCRTILSAFCIFMALLFLPSLSFSQSPDSTKKDTVIKHSPVRASLYSTFLPGLGQAYNKKYWKIPVVYAGMGSMLYLYSFSQNNYKKFKNAYTELNNSSDPSGTIVVDGVPYILNGLEQRKKDYRRNRDMFIIFTAGFYLINIVDASVDAHLFDFDVSDDLSMQVCPIMFQYNQKSMGAGLTLKLTLR